MVYMICNTPINIFLYLELELKTRMVDETCRGVIDYHIFGISPFNMFCSLLLFVMFFSSTIPNCCVKDKHTSSGVPKNVRGTFHKNVEKLRRALFFWNWLWLAFQILMALDSFFKGGSILTLVIVKASIWLVSLYMEFVTTFFVFLPVNSGDALERSHYWSIFLALLSAIGCLIIDISTNSLFSPAYFVYDFCWSVFRFLGILTYYIVIWCCSSTAITGGKKDAHCHGRSWVLFMLVTYGLNSTQEMLHLFDDNSSHCVKIATKAIYFFALSPILTYTINKNNQRWNSSLTALFEEAAAKEWKSKVEKVFPDEGKVEVVAASLRSVVHSPLSNFLMQSTDLVAIDHAHRNIGEGSFGTVQLYKYKGNMVAVKFVKMSALLEQQEGEPSEAICCFKREFSHFLELHACPHVAKFVGLFFEIGASGPKVGVAIEYCEKGSLLDNLPYEVDDNSEYTTMLAHVTWPTHPLQLAMNVARALQILHDQFQYIFVDLKPANIVISTTFEAKLIDLGSIWHLADSRSCACFSASCCNKGIEMKNLLAWTDAYASPEILLARADSLVGGTGAIPISKASDVWCLAHILWHLVTGFKYPFVIIKGTDIGYCVGHGAQKIRLIERSTDVLEYYHRQGLRPPLPTTLPLDLANLISDCWAADPTKRPSMMMVISRLANIIAILPPTNNEFFSVANLTPKAPDVPEPEIVELESVSFQHHEQGIY